MAHLRNLALFLTLCFPLAIAIGGCNESSPNGAKPNKPAAENGTDAAPEKPEQLAGGYDAGAMAKRIAESMSQLSDADRTLAEAQKFCPVGVEFDDNDQPISGFLGSIGKPVKVMAGDQPVFIMCPNCTEKFAADTDKYLKVLAKINASQPVEEE